MMKQFLVFSLLIVVFSCGDKAPKDLLSIRQMQDIKWDLMRADEIVEYYRTSDTLYKAEQEREAYYAKIFSLHQTDKDVFKRSLNYYTARPRELKQILDALQARAQKEAEADTVKTAIDTASIKRDSVRRPLSFDSFKRKKVLNIKR